MAVTGPYLCFLPKVVPFGEISVYRSDPRHVAKLMSRSDGLDVVSTARKRRWGDFFWASFSGFRERGEVVSDGGW